MQTSGGAGVKWRYEDTITDPGRGGGEGGRIGLGDVFGSLRLGGGGGGGVIWQKYHIMFFFFF